MLEVEEEDGAKGANDHYFCLGDKQKRSARLAVIAGDRRQAGCQMGQWAREIVPNGQL